MHLLYAIVLRDAVTFWLLRLILLSLPTLGAFFVALFVRDSKLVSALSLAPIGATIGVVSMSLYDRVGLYVDSVGGPFETFVIFLVYHTSACVIGAISGLWVYRMIARGNAKSVRNRGQIWSEIGSGKSGSGKSGSASN